MMNTIRPIQTLSWAEKEANNKQWYKDNINYGISAEESMTTVVSVDGRDLAMLYQVYNNKFPSQWFNHITDPLSAKAPQHKAFPAKIRPVTILRPNIDLLLGEYPRRPFIYQVNNLGEGGYNNYTEALQKKVQQNIQQHFDQQFQATLAQMSGEEAQQAKQPPLPEKLLEEFHATYKDAIAIKGQQWLNRAVKEYKVKQKHLKMFKDWLIAGDVVSYKGIEHGSFCYERISPLHFRCEKSADSDLYEDAESQTVKRLMTVSDVVDRFYEDLSKEDIIGLERSNFRTAQTFYDTLSSQAGELGLIPVWHRVWKARKKVNILHTIDPETGEEQMMQVDEAYVPSKALSEWVEVIWPNEIYEGWKIGHDIYTRMQPIAVQRNQMNNFSAAKMPYNGRKFSNTHAQNLSVLEIGIPFQIMYIIVTRTLELTIAKSKGKILLIDHAAIPNEGDWNEEKFFYYAEALGYGLLNRNQIGVDKSWNQYQVLDMTLFDTIKQLIDLQSYFKEQWDDVLGVNRQRKGQTYASDAVGTTERATFQSTIMTDIIYNLFEEFTESEMQGILDFSKFVNVDGVKAVWNDDEFGTQIMEIDPNTYCSADLGVLVDSSTEAITAKNKMEATTTAMLQNKVKPSVIAEVIQTKNIAELKTKLKRIEELEAQAQQALQEGEEANAKAADERKMRYAEFENSLEKGLMNETYDRKQEIQNSINATNTFTFQDGDSNNNGVPDYKEVQEALHNKEKLEAETRGKDLDWVAKVNKDNQDAALKSQDLAIKNKQVDLQHKAAMKPKPTTKK